MQKLTRRGIQLAEKFRKLGIPVIESYPGAAQDILAIPRKRAGLNYLADALVEFGIYDNFTDKNISHDELDAITSAIVGIFFWTGKFEGIGNFDEEDLIIPDLAAKTKNWISRKVVGLSGSIGSGKTTVADYLKSKGFEYFRYSQILEDILNERGLAINRSNLQEVGQEIHVSKGQRWLGKQLIENIPSHYNLVVDGLRFPEDHALMVEEFGPSFQHIHIETSNHLIESRIEIREIEDIPLQQAVYKFTESEISQLKKLSGRVLKNDLDISALYSRVNKILYF